MTTVDHTHTHTHTHTHSSTLIVEHDDARSISTAEATDLLREALSLTHKRLGSSLRLALDTTHMWWRMDTSASPHSGPGADRMLIGELRRHHEDLAGRFLTVFDEAFRERVQGRARAAKRRGNSGFELGLVDPSDLSGQVALKEVIRAMHHDTKEELYALNFRVRLLLREASDGGPFDNPWGPDYLCDAFGVVCRDLWKEITVWRPIMEQLIRFMTPHAVKLYQDLNAFLQDHDILPTLRVRVRARTGDGREPLPTGASLFAKLSELMNPASTSTAFAGTVMGGGRGPGGAEMAPRAPGPAARAVQGTLDQLQRGHVQASARPAPGLSGDALLGGRGNLLPQIKVALGDRMTADDRITLDIVAGFFEYLFQEPSLPDEMKVVFGQLQVPVLKAALLDRRLFSDAAHPARAFVDTLADAAAGLDVQREDDAALLQLARRLVAYIRDQFGDDVSVFAGAQLELDSFLNQERVRRAERMSRAMEPLVREDAHAAARAEVEPELTARLVGKAVPLAIKTFLENEWLDHLATVYREQGAASEAWRKELEVLTDLSWSLTPKMNDNDRRRLAQVAPQLVRAFNQGRPVEAAAEPRRKAFLASLFMRHVKALRGSDELPPDSGMRPGQAAAREDEQDEFDDQVAELIRGDWLEFQRPEEDRRIIAKLAWRSPQRTRLLFTYRDGSMAFVHSPDTLAEEFRNGRARIAMEAGPLFERAIARMIGRYRKAASRTGSAARGP